jgi:adenylate kinase family enzyme
LAKALNSPYIELDQLFWKPNWEQPTDEEFFKKIENALNQETWILDGNYTRTIPVKWKNVTCIIWIDYNFSRTLYQAVKRAIVRIRSRQEIWPNTGNVETFKKTFMSKDSILIWTLKTFKKNRINYSKLEHDPKISHIKFIRIQSPKEAQQFINEVKK